MGILGMIFKKMRMPSDVVDDTRKLEHEKYKKMLQWNEKTGHYDTIKVKRGGY